MQAVRNVTFALAAVLLNDWRLTGLRAWKRGREVSKKSRVLSEKLTLQVVWYFEVERILSTTLSLLETPNEVGGSLNVG